MSLFNWNGPEEDLSCACCVQNLTVELLDDKEGGKYAKGTITAIDYVEHGIIFTDPWEATGILFKDQTYHWNVKRLDDENVFWRYPETKEPAFTANEGINNGIKSFVCAKIGEFMAGATEQKISEYTGPKEKYNGPCVCNGLHLSSNTTLFLWKEKTNEKFPENCFECSCGKTWWHINPANNQWIEVIDDKAWDLLLKYNGVETKKLTIFKDQLYLLQTVRDMGYIPVG